MRIANLSTDVDGNYGRLWSTLAAVAFVYPDRSLITCRDFMIRGDDGTIKGNRIRDTQDRAWRIEFENIAMASSSNKREKKPLAAWSNIDTRAAHGPEHTVRGEPLLTLDP